MEDSAMMLSWKQFRKIFLSWKTSSNMEGVHLSLLPRASVWTLTHLKEVEGFGARRRGSYSTYRTTANESAIAYSVRATIRWNYAGTGLPSNSS